MRFVLPVFSVVLAAGWLVFLTAGTKIASIVGGKFGAAIQRVAKGKVSDPVIFMYERGKEFLLLLTVLSLLVLLLSAASSLLRKRHLRYTWAILGLSAFAALNIWFAAAAHTALFWGAMFTGNRTANYTQFEFKRTLLEEHKAPHTALLLGSSQTQAQIDENQLNALIGTNLWTTELHFPGSAGLDVFLIYEQLRRTRGEVLIIYLSEGYFFNGLHTEAPPFFATLQQIPLLRSFGLDGEIWSKSFRYGYVAQLIPLFRAREAITHRLLGPDLGLLGQMAHDVTLQTDLEKRAEAVTHLFEFDRYVEVHKRGFEEFVRRASADARRIILLEGQLNPVLSKRLPSRMRAELRRFLADLESRYPAVYLVPESKLPPQEASDYVDLTHVTPQAQQEFTAWLAGFLEKKFAKE